MANRCEKKGIKYAWKILSDDAVVVVDENSKANSLYIA